MPFVTVRCKSGTQPTTKSALKSPKNFETLQKQDWIDYGWNSRKMEEFRQRCAFDNLYSPKRWHTV